MAIPLKQSTASQEVPLGPFVDATDGVTQETALTISNTDIKIWKSGATTLADKNSGGATHISNGIYYAVLDATDTDTLGPLVIFVQESGALPVRLECVVLNANNYDSAIAASDNLQVDVVQFGGTNLTATGGRPEVNTSHIAGSAVSTTSAQIGVNVVQISTDATAADNLEAMLDGTGGVTLSATLSDLSSTIADSVAVDGSRPTIKQALLMITRFLMERGVSGTTVTVNKEDGTTAAMTFTLDDGTTPTAITRAT